MMSQYLLFCVIWTFLSGISAQSSVSVARDTLSLQQDEIISRRKRSSNDDTHSYFFYQQLEYPRDCKEVYDHYEEQPADGVYLVKPEGFPKPFEVYCNNSIDGGGWTVFQRRVDGSVDFYRNWKEFKNGFGFLSREFWLGNDKISYLTNQKSYELRIDLNNVNGQPYFAKYNLFRISDERSNYRLVGLGEYDSSSTAGYDAFRANHNQSFSTPNRDKDHSGFNTARHDHGAWWYWNNGGYCRLNGLYNAGSANHKSIYWYNLPGGVFHIKYTDRKVRPLQ